MGRLAVTALATLGAAGPAWACGVCFTSERSGSLLLAYYLTTALLTTLVLAFLTVWIVVLARRYVGEEPERSADPIEGGFPGSAPDRI
jgi:hypothetical protein